jgi:predicted transcriptional regulator
MTPFQQSVYDAIDGETDIDEIKRKLIRYKSKNFEDKICKNLKSLIDMNLVEKQGDVYKKIK